jgi:hypothetical protein
MKQILLIIAVVMGQSVLAADDKPLIADPIVEKAIRGPFSLGKPKGELTKADLEKVTYLGLLFTKTTDAGLKDIAKLQQLIFLNLGSTEITDAGLKVIAKLQNLKVLFLTFTKITKAGAAELKKALPKCAIISNPTK